MESRHKLIVGVDYGTTYSGVAYVTTQGSDVKDIQVITDWPGGSTGKNNEYLEKVPSQIAYASENPGLSQDAWGYQVEPGQINYSWTKLLLDQHARATEHDDPTLQETAGGGMMKLPHNKTAVDVAADYLSKIYENTMAVLERTVSKELLAVTPIEWWFTMPAIWSDEAQNATETAAVRAGFSSRPGDEINMITEPEAAAIAALKATHQKFDDLLQVNTGILVCDAGGGTVDITSYAITATDPALKLDESCVGIGGKCGATYVDRNLHALLALRYKQAFTGLPLAKRGPGSRFMTDFESVKKDFRGESTKVRRLRLIMKDLEHIGRSVEGYDAEEGEITLSNADLKSCFDPVLRQILGLISQQIRAIAAEGAPEIKTIVLVGGLGSSPYLFKKVLEWCLDNGSIRLMTPDRPWSAIARGAALRGLEGALVVKKRCRRHYGVSLGRPFRPFLDSEDELCGVDPFSGIKFTFGWMDWQISKGEKIMPETKKSITASTHFEEGGERQMDIVLYSSALDDAPVRQTHDRVERVGKITVSFEKINLESLQSKKSDIWPYRMLYEVTIRLEVSLGHKRGTLQYAAFCKDKECGTATIDFSAEPAKEFKDGSMTAAIHGRSTENEGIFITVTENSQVTL